MKCALAMLAWSLRRLHPRRPEINVRHTAFRKGSAYLERYCMLITFAVYLEAQKSRNQVKLTFEEWMSARPEILAARDALHQNPAGALAPVSQAKMPHMWLSTERHNSREVTCLSLCMSSSLQPFRRWVLSVKRLPFPSHLA